MDFEEQRPMEEQNLQPEQSVRRRRKKKAEKKGLAYEIYTLLHDVVYILAVITIVFVFAFRLVGVDGDSMFSTLHNKDYLILKANSLISEYECGDIVVATVPTFHDEVVVKRIIAKEGQKVDVIYDALGVGTVYVDGVALDEPYINEPMEGGEYANLHTVVPEGYVFLMGDNRNHSADSRYFGCVDQRYLLGKALIIALPGDNVDTGHSGGERELSRIGSVY